jgi:hypothetical protein
MTNYFYCFGDTTGLFASTNILPLVASVLAYYSSLVILGIPNNLLVIFQLISQFLTRATTCRHFVPLVLLHLCCVNCRDRNEGSLNYLNI